MPRPRPAPLLALPALGLTSAAAAQWSIVRLHPDGFYESQAFAAAGGQQAGYLVTPLPAGRTLPVIWNASSSNWTNLIPGPTDNGQVDGLSADTQVGTVNGRAALWHGTAASFVDLAPPNTFYSEAHGVSGDMQAGEASFNGMNGRRAILWRGSAASYVNLHPAAATESWADTTDGVRQGGVASFSTTTSSVFHAALWSGSAASFIDLTPSSQVFDAEVTAMAGDQQVGFIEDFVDNQHAALWHGTPQSLVDLNPGPTAFSHLYGTDGNAQVGYVGGPLTGIGITAAIWFGTAESWIPLGGLLPPGYSESIASAVSFHDGQYYVAGYAYNVSTAHFEAFLWTGVPAPSSLTLLAAAALLTPRRRR